MKKNNFMKVFVSIVIILIIFFSLVKRNRGINNLFMTNFTTAECEEDCVEEVCMEDAVYETKAFGAAPQMLRASKQMDFSNNSFDNGANYVNDDGIMSSDRKIVKTLNLTAETKDFDSAVDYIQTYVEKYTGQITNSHIDSGRKDIKNYRKYAHFTIKVPAEKLDSFLDEIGGGINIISKNLNIEDVTDTYDDSESRKKSLLLEQEKLNSLMARATSVEDMVKIEDKLSNVRYELENIEKRLKRLDGRIIYSTIELTLEQVVTYTEDIDTKDYSIEGILKQLKANFRATIRYIKNALIYLFVHLPSIIFVLILSIILAFIISKVLGIFIKTDGESKIKIVKAKNEKENVNQVAKEAQEIQETQETEDKENEDTKETKNDDNLSDNFFISRL